MKNKKMEYHMLTEIKNNFINNPITFNEKLPNNYVTDYKQLKDFFLYSPYNDTAIIETIKLRSDIEYPRQELANILKEMNKDNSNEKVFKNIKLLNKNNTFAIITGQQPDLLTGPLYIIYKIITSIKLAEKFNNNFPKYNFVPIFWVNSDDHDIEEINQFSFLDKNNSVKRFSFKLNRTKTSASKINLNPQDINEVKTFINENLITSEYTENLINSLENAYAKSLNINKFFILLIQNLFNKWGLIIVDGSNNSLKKLGRKIFENEINQPLKLTNIVQQYGTMLLNTGFHKQVELNPESCNFFVEQNNERKKVIYSENNFIIDNKKYSSAELLAELGNKPELFSPNVVLRPILQDYLIPTIIYIGGPSEISYYAQFVKEGYEIFNLISPIIWPRASATIIEKSNEKIMDKFNISIEKILSTRPNIIINSIVENKYGKKINEIIDTYKLAMKNADIELDSKIKIDYPDLINIHSKMKIIQEKQIQKLKNKMNEKILKNEQLEIKQINKLYNQLYPENIFQERMINIYYFLNKYGDGFLDNIYQQMIVDKPGHNVFYL
ncbi:bacillithiol biosynthesis cysteine-adding enzyme BshC [Candidatus Poribacteria bacterium]|nr:bacillithiol biosynthesis cysteine-adding enzyme BshC [Candidatus Poribacteria bacterium]